MRRAPGRAFRAAMIAGALVAASAALAYDDRGVSPDLAAWETFAEVVAPSGEPGAPRVEFETWASDDDLFAFAPPRWPSEGPPRSTAECRETFDRAAAASAEFPADACIREDVRRNWAAIHYLVSHDLTSKAGLARAFARALEIDLPADSVQVKADWMKVGDLARWLRLDESEIRRTYYTEVERKGETEYALVGVHVNAKRWKNWLWATFENRLNPGRCDEIGCHDSFGAAIAHVLGRDAPNQNYGECEKTPALVAMFADAGLSPVWLNYCLKGSQVAFADKTGRPNLLGNSMIDRINGHVPLAHSSCISCHALASFDKSGKASGAFADDATGDVGAARLQDGLSSNFIWGVAKAR